MGGAFRKAKRDDATRDIDSKLQKERNDFSKVPSSLSLFSFRRMLDILSYLAKFVSYLFWVKIFL